MSERTSNKAPFDDTDLPVNDLSIERVEEIEKIALPRMEKAFEKLKRHNPDLFKK